MAIPDDLTGAFPEDFVDQFFSDNMERVEFHLELLAEAHDALHTQGAIQLLMTGPDSRGFVITSVIHLAIEDLEARVKTHYEMLKIINN